MSSKRYGKGSEEDLEYMRSLAAAVVQRSPRHLMLVLATMGLLLGTAITWMNLAEVDVVVRGNGKVIPSQQLQVVQSLEGGVVSDILVAEGDVVGVNQPLIKISDIAFSSSFEENQLQYWELRANIVRLRAEADDTGLSSDKEILEDAPELMRAARRLFEARRQELQESLQILNEQVRQQESELVEAQAKRRQLKRSLALMREELAIKAPLVKKGLVSQVEFLQLKQRENEMAGEIESVELSSQEFDPPSKRGSAKLSNLGWTSAARPDRH